MNVAFIPVSGNLKSKITENIKLLNRKPLIYWAVAAACECASINEVYVYTDSEDIRTVVEKFCRYEKKKLKKVTVIDGTFDTAEGMASEEGAMLEFAGKYDFDNIVLINSSVPLLTGSDLDDGFAIFEEKDTDSVLSAVPQKRFFWNMDENGMALVPNNDGKKGSLSQKEIEEYYVENGAFYITSKKNLEQSGYRISGNIKISLMSDESLWETDKPGNWETIEGFMKRRDELKNADSEKSNITITELNKEDGVELTECKYKMFLTDCDGCLTDGGMYYSEKGDEMKKFNTKDGMGFGILREAGIITGVVTGEDRALNRRRCEKLKLDILAPGCLDKAACIRDLCVRYNIDLSEVVYIGDDINDREALQMVGLGCCPQDAHFKIKQVADYVANAKGGEGVIREVVDMIMG